MSINPKTTVVVFIFLRGIAEKKEGLKYNKRKESAI